MSKETIRYKCGHTGIFNLSGNSSARRRKAKWLGDNGVCDQCEAKQRADDSAAASAANANSGLPALKGSEKQTAWAETIRKRMIDALAPLAVAVNFERERIALQPGADASALYARATPVFNALAHDLTKLLQELRTPERYDAFTGIMRTQIDAAWWIDCRDDRYASIAKRHRNAIDKAAYNAKASPEEKAAEQAAIQEATIRPSVSPVSLTLAEIRHVANNVEIHFPEKRDDFRSAVNRLVVSGMVNAGRSN